MIAGLAVGFKTGHAGLSAAIVIVRLLISILHVNSYETVGIALASHYQAGFRKFLSAAVYRIILFCFYSSSLRCLASYLLKNFQQGLAKSDEAHAWVCLAHDEQLL